MAEPQKIEWKESAAANEAVVSAVLMWCFKVSVYEVQSNFSCEKKFLACHENTDSMFFFSVLT